MELYTALCKIKWSYHEDGVYYIKNDYAIYTHVANSTEAMRKIEDYYNDDLISAEVTLIDGPCFMIEKSQYDSLIKNLSEGFQEEIEV